VQVNEIFFFEGDLPPQENLQVEALEQEVLREDGDLGLADPPLIRLRPLLVGSEQLVVRDFQLVELPDLADDVGLLLQVELPAAREEGDDQLLCLLAATRALCEEGGGAALRVAEPPDLLKNPDLEGAVRLRKAQSDVLQEQRQLGERKRL